VLVQGIVVGTGPRQPLTIEQLREENAALHATVARQAKRLKLQTATPGEPASEPEHSAQADVAASTLSTEDSLQTRSADVINTVYDALGIAGDEGVRHAAPSLLSMTDLLDQSQLMSDARVHAPLSAPWSGTSTNLSYSIAPIIPYVCSKKLVELSLKFTLWQHCTVDPCDFHREHDTWLEGYAQGIHTDKNDFLALCECELTISAHTCCPVLTHALL
jgi:hypothetical protein